MEPVSTIEPMKTRRLYLFLLGQINNGQLGAGARLPSEPALAQEHKVSRVTVRRALDQLQSEGLLQRMPGIGTFVKDRPIVQPIKANLVDMLAHLVEMGRDTAVRLLSFAYVEPPPTVAKALRLEPGEQTQRSIRVRSSEDGPFSYLTTYVPKSIGSRYSEVDLAATPMLELLERSGVVVEGASQTITATLADPEVAKELDVGIGSPLISLARVIYSNAGEGVEYLHGLYRPDRYSLHVDLVHAREGRKSVWRANGRASKKN
jgi:GntR family transcriptional regulator